jgi:hypothetical protein
MRVENAPLMPVSLKKTSSAIRWAEAGELGGYGLVQVGDLGLLDGVEQLVAHVVAAIGQRVDGADHQRVGALGFPAAVVDVVDVVDDAGVDDLEGAAAFQVGLDDLGNFCGDTPSLAKPAMATGIWLLPTPEISIRIWACALPMVGDDQPGVEHIQFFHISAFPSI